MFGVNNLEDKVKVPSKKKYPCKRNKGEHEWLEPTIIYSPYFEYVYKTYRGTLHSGEPQSGYKLENVYVKLTLETRCKHCGHKCVSWLSDKLK